MKTTLILSALAASCLLLSGCKPSVTSLRHDDFASLTRWVHSGDMNAEIQALVEHYIQTGDARYATPEHRFTMLHLAAGTQRYWLVNKLLAEGADPNARLERPIRGEDDEVEVGDTPAMLAVRAGQQGSNIDSLLIVKALMAHGADINLRGFNGETILGVCEDMFRRKTSDPMGRGGALVTELIKLGAKGNLNAALNAIREGWPDALEALLASPEGTAIAERMPELLQKSASSFNTDEGQLSCAKILLQHATPEQVRGTPEESPLFTLCKEVCQEGGRSYYMNGELLADYVALLLQHGADLLQPAGEFRMTCAADHLAVRPGMAEKLRERGITLAAPAHHFAPETLVEQLLDIPTRAVSKDEARTQFDTIAIIFTAPTEAMLAHRLLYRQACSRALQLLFNATDTIEPIHDILLPHPAWTQPAAWEGEADAARGLLVALSKTRALALPKEHLLSAAHTMLQAGKPGVAHAFILLLGHDSSAAELIEELCADTTPLPLRAAAWCCKLEQQRDPERHSYSSRSKHSGLPAPGDIADWLSNEHYMHSEEEICLYPIVCTAVLAEASKPCLSKLASLTMPERLFYESDGSEGTCATPDDETLSKRQDALRRLGAPLAARLCGDTQAEEPTPEVEEIAARYGMATAASLELELALARYVWENREVFRHPRDHRGEETRR